MKKMHALSVSTNFTKAMKKGETFNTNDWLLRFEFNKITILPLNSHQYWDWPLGSVLQHLEEVLRKYNVKHFQRLDFHFVLCLGLNTSFLRKLGRIVANHFKNLQVLTFTFVTCKNLTDKGLENLLSAFAKGLKALRKLEINMDAYAKIKDQGIHYMRKSLFKHLKNVKNIRFDFAESLTDLADSSKTLKLGPMRFFF